jgi:hypothetical protein
MRTGSKLRAVLVKCEITDRTLSPQSPGFNPGSVHMGFVVDKMTLGQDFPRVLRFSSVNFILPLLHDKEKNTNHLHHRVAQ